MTSKPSLVSVIMPAYKLQYMEQVLDSLLSQSYSELELIVCDDSTDGDIATLLQQKQEQADFPIHYFKNGLRLGETVSTAKGIKKAKGKYIKLLHDDDVLEPDAIASLVAAIESEPDIALVSSRRQRIDEDGEPLPDILATRFPFASDVIINGPELVSFLGDHTINFIGEPSCVLARRDDLMEMISELMSLNGKAIEWVGDLALYVKLLQRGNLAFLAKPLTKFRVSKLQFSQQGRDQAGIGEQGHANFRKAIRDLGWYRTTGNNRMVQVAPITQLKARVFKPVDVLQAIHRAAGFGSVSLSDWLGVRKPDPVQKSLMEQRLSETAHQPDFTVLLLDSDGDQAAVDKTLNSLDDISLYRKANAVVLSASATVADTHRTLPLNAANPVASINQALQLTDAAWVVVAKAGVEFTASGLMIAALDLLDAPETCLAVYADEILTLADGEPGLLLRPDINLDLLLSFPAAQSRHWLLRRNILLDQGGFNEAAGTAFELEYQLRLVEQYGLASIGHISEPLLSSAVFALQDNPDEQQVIQQHLQVRGYPDAVINSHLPGRYQLDYQHTLQASVSILVVVKDQLVQTQRCIETLLENTSYSNYEVLLLDHGNQQDNVCQWLAGIEAMNIAQLRVLRFDASTPEVEICNAAAQQARGDFLLWLGAGAGIIGKDWLQQLLNHGLRPEVGAVGAKLLSADGKIRHAGLLTGLGGPAGRAFAGRDHKDPGYMQRLQVEQNYSAVSRECLLLRKELFLQADGFDQDPLISRWVDVDLCLRLQQAGYLNVWTPRVQLLMDETATSNPSLEEEDAMYQRWLPVLARDQAYNPGFTLRAEPGFELAEPQLSWQPLQSWRPLPVVLAHPADSDGCGNYRVIQPFHAMHAAGLIQGAMSQQLLQPTLLERFSPDTIIFQRQTRPERLDAMRRSQAFSRAFKIYELDDYLPNLPLKSIHRKHLPKDIVKSLRKAMGFVDRFVVSTEALAEAFAGFHSDIRVMENRLPSSWWKDLGSQRRTSAKPRVGWAGGISHTGDLDLIIDVVKELADEVEWVFFGMCPEKIRPYVHEYHTGIPISQYPAKLASLNLDLALAPVEVNVFNECKSNLRLLEYGACGFPVICSDIRCYQDPSFPVTRVKNRFRDWVDAIRLHLADMDATAKMGDDLQALVYKHWMLESDNIQQNWRKIWLPD